jgi:hypothetical protein
MFSGITELLSGADAPNPQEVADVVAKLIATPAGERPLRVLVGGDAQVALRLNQVAAEAQRGLVQSFGMGQ